MVEQLKKDYDVGAIREALYGDALSATTEKSGRNLLLVATVTLVTSVTGVTVTSTPFVPLDFSKQPDALLMFLAIANFALLINYTLRALNDILKASEDWARMKRAFEIERIMFARRSAQDVDNAILSGDPGGAEYEPMPDEWWEHYLETRTNAEERIREIEARLANRRLPIFVRWIRLIFFGSLPALVGAAAFSHTVEHVLAFFFAVLEV